MYNVIKQTLNDVIINNKKTLTFNVTGHQSAFKLLICDICLPKLR